jgi:hypothetical protein
MSCRESSFRRDVGRDWDGCHRSRPTAGGPTRPSSPRRHSSPLKRGFVLCFGASFMIETGVEIDSSLRTSR